MKRAGRPNSQRCRMNGRTELGTVNRPCSALRAITRQALGWLRLRGDYTLIMVTHDIAQAQRLAEAGPAAQVFQRPSNPLTAKYLSREVG